MSIYAGIALSTLQARLTEAQDAFHALNTGAQVVSLAQGDQRLSFSPADIDRLRIYIRDLQNAISIVSGSSAALSLYSVGRWTR